MTDIIDLMRLEVISTELGKLFVFRPGPDNSSQVKASERLSSHDELVQYQFVVCDRSGAEKQTFYVVGNPHDYDTRFTLVPHEWFAEDATWELAANDFEVGDQVIIKINKPEHLRDYEFVQFSMAVWVLLTHIAGSAGFLDISKVRYFTRRQRKARQE